MSPINPAMEILISFANGSSEAVPFHHYSDARDFWQRGISYSGGRVRRVELITFDGSTRAIWDSSWDAISQIEGLRG